MQCYITLRDDKSYCKNHPKGKNYNGIDLYSPSDWVKLVVGKKYKGYDGKIYICTGYDPAAGFWMKDENSSLINISERAIDRTFHVVRNF